MRKTVSAILLCMILLVPNQAFSATAAKAGASCPKVGIIQVIHGTKFSCVRSGKKLLWRKGAAEAHSTKSPNPTPIQTSIPVVVPTPDATPTAAATSASSPTPTPEFSLETSPQSTYSPAMDCKLQDQTGTIFNLGYPRKTVIKDYAKVRIFAIPFEFTDSRDSLVGWEKSKQMMEEVTSYFSTMSYGKTKLEFTSPPINPTSGKPQSIVIPQTLVDADLLPNQVSLIHQILQSTPVSWNLGSFDSVLIYSNDLRTLPLMGGQAWQQPPGWNLQPPQVGPFQSPSGDIESLVFTSNHSDVISHEIAHAILGYVDLYRLPDFSNEVYAQNWGMMDAAYTADYGIFAWEKWLARWISDEQVRCISNGASATTFLSFNELPSTSVKMVVLKTSNTQAYVLEARGVPRTCIYENFCWGGSKVGILAYQVDITKLSAQGVIQVPPELKWPEALTPDNNLNLGAFRILVNGCNSTGCFVTTSSN